MTSWVCHQLPEIKLHHLLPKPFTFSTSSRSTVVPFSFLQCPSLSPAPAVRGASASGACGRPRWRLPPRRSWRWSPTRGGGSRPLSDPAGDLQDVDIGRFSLACLVCAVFVGFLHVTYRGGGQCLRIKCAQREWPGRR